MKRTAYYPGSFDPLTNGHLDVLTRALALFDTVVIGIGVHPGKTPMFSFEERADLIEASLEAGARGRIRSKGSTIWWSGRRDRPARLRSCAVCATGPISTTKCRWLA